LKEQIFKKESKMKGMIFFITLAILLSAGIILMTVQVYAQKQITLINPSFEKPDSGKLGGFDGKGLKPGVKTGIDIPGWNVNSSDSSQYDSGIEKKATSNGQYDAYIMGHDPGIYQILNRRVADDDMLKLTVDARNSWQATALKMELFYLDNDTIAKANRVTMVSETKTLTNNMTSFSISINASAIPLAVGHKIGILLDNVTPAPNDSASWLELDNVRLTNEDPTIIEVPNYSFELPDSNKIKGWNGPGSGIQIANSQADIPGWASDAPVTDSGIEQAQGLPDGIYRGFLKGSDTSVWNTTNYTIQTGDVITLRVMALNNWQATLFHLELYYVDGLGERVLIEYVDETLTNNYAEYSVAFDASTAPASVGKKLGVLLDNISPVGDSWLNMDLVRINANHAVVSTSVSGTQVQPKAFSLAQNYPNPFNPSTNISYTLKNSGKIRLAVFDLLGREVAILANEIQAAGLHEVIFSANGLSSGIYFYKLQAANEVITKKMMLLK
jgi:broad specificity phosphatase PhoE